jgi:hypothetical protein
MSNLAIARGFQEAADEEGAALTVPPASAAAVTSPSETSRFFRHPGASHSRPAAAMATRNNGAARRA